MFGIILEIHTSMNGGFMNKHFFCLSLMSLVLVSTGCQKTPEVSTGTFTAEEQTGTTIVNNLCEDGTLNCIIEDNEFNDTASILQQLYDQCYDGCMVQPGATVGSCNSLCDDILDTPADAWESDELRIPDNSMAVEVEIEACIDTQVNNTIRLQGPTMSIAHYRTNESQLMGSPGLGSRGNPVGLNLKCKIEGLYNKVKVTYKPVEGSSVTIKGAPHTVVPFTGVGQISKTYRSPHVSEWGIPKTIRDRMNVGQHAWLLKKAKGPLNISTVVQFQHQNNDMGPLSLVHVFPPLHFMTMKFNLVFFAPAATE